jgi:hypothetical protein
MRRLLCRCGRKIRVNYSKGRKGVRRPPDGAHDMCSKCWKAERDRMRVG